MLYPESGAQTHAQPGNVMLKLTKAWCYWARALAHVLGGYPSMGTYNAAYDYGSQAITAMCSSNEGKQSVGYLHV